MAPKKELAPIKLNLDAGTHWLCSCGLSKNFPHCDGSHQGTGLQPLTLELNAPKVVEVSGVVPTKKLNS
ncbi:MAG: CDGSH iron-sulfur domain-containing protein (plasmid) [Nodularia sp. CChRGM 3473]